MAIRPPESARAALLLKSKEESVMPRFQAAACGSIRAPHQGSPAAHQVLPLASINSVPLAAGIGEQLIRADFARSVVRLIRDSEDYSLSLSNFMETFYHANIGSSQRPAAGFICHASQAGFDEFWYGYSTPSFGIGYMSSSNPSPTIMIERLPPNSRFRIGGVSL